MLVTIEGRTPRVGPGAWLAPGAVLIGDVELLDGASIWYTSVLRADCDAIRIGAGSNIQDGCVVHTDPGRQAVVGAGVSVGHRAVLHGCFVDDNCLIGMGATVLNGAVIGSGSLVAAGAVVLEGTTIGPNSLVAGVPGRVRRETTDAEREAIRENALVYQRLRDLHRTAATG